jgi:hypothetical protein
MPVDSVLARLAAIAGAVVLATGSSAPVSASSANLGISVTVTNNCRIDTAGSVRVACTKGAVYVIDLPSQGVPSRSATDSVIVTVDF